MIVTDTHVRRETKYTVALRKAAVRLGHATNAELAAELRKQYPYVSDTTVHRVSQRLYASGQLTLAPPAKDGAVRYDSIVDEHDHFVCEGCDSLRNMHVPQACRALIQHQLGGCRVTGRLTITGICEGCSPRAKGIN